MTKNTPSFRLHRDPLDRLMLTDAAGGPVVEVRPMRMFPITEPDRWVALCDADGKELACIEDPAELPEPTGTLLREELQRTEFLPVIQQIRRVSAVSTPCEWDVDTDRGPTKFLLNSEDDLHPFGTSGVLIRDAHGTRYLVPDSHKLDAASRRTLLRFL